MTDIEVYANDDTTLHTAILVDIDGTVAHNNGHRGFYDWEAVGGDDPIPAVINIVKMFWSQGTEVIFFSGRDEVCRPETVDWLIKHEIPFDQLHMRPLKSGNPDSEVKYKMFNDHVRDRYRVLAVFDDRLSVVRLWHSLGLPLFRVGDPDADF